MTLIDAIQEEEKLVNLSATESEKFKRYDELIDKVRQLIDSGADVNEKDEEGRSVLMRTSLISVARMLIEAGADVNAVDQDGKTALMGASLMGRKEVVEFLIQKGAAWT